VADVPSPKKGVDIKAPPACQDVEALNAAWYLNWVPWPDSTCGNGDLAKFVPRLLNADYMQHLPEAIENAKASGWLIGFTEPNRPEQGDISPEEAARLWKQIEEAADAAGVKLVSPSPVENKGEVSWLWAMIEAYKDQNCPADRTCKPRFDAIGWNLYGCTNNPNCMDINCIKSNANQNVGAAKSRNTITVSVWSKSVFALIALLIPKGTAIRKIKTREEIFMVLKHAYKLRSDIVHGGRKVLKKDIVRIEIEKGKFIDYSFYEFIFMPFCETYYRT